MRSVVAAVTVVMCCLSSNAQDSPAVPDAVPAAEPAPEASWDDDQLQLDKLPQRRPTSPRELLNLFGIDASQLAQLTDGEPLAEQDEETVVKILYRLPRFQIINLESWTKDVSWDELTGQPDQYRAEAIQVRGRATWVERVALVSELAELLEFTHYYRVRVAVEDGGSAIICSRKVPQSWPLEAAIDEPIAARGLFLKLTAASDDATGIALATTRIEWFPTQEQPQLGVSADHTYLASLGMDVGLFDDVRSRKASKVTYQDRECFYGLLAAVGSADPEVFRQRAAERFKLAPLFQSPAEQHGRLMTVQGVAWRVMRVRVEDEIRQRFGFDHYFHIDLFIQLGNQQVVLGKKDAKERPRFVDRYPLTICTLELPPDLPESEDMRQEIEVPVAHFKLWSYRSKYVSSLDPGGRQVSPMMIGSVPRLVHREPITNPVIGMLIAVAVVGGIAVVWAAAWWSNRRDAAFSKRVLSKQYNLPPGKTLNDGSVAGSDGPDFSNLD